jgi:uncharacterized protein (TIGR02600 family)
MDLFQMPVVEPYPISDPLSTTGKINMNYQIIPFTYINRNTGLRAVLKSEMIAAVPDADIDRSKEWTNRPSGYMYTSNQYRFPLNLEEEGGTLRQFKERFKSGDIFHSATEICDIYLVPQGQNWSSDEAAKSFWSTRRVLGEDVKERPYTVIYPRLTTKSNTYTIHYRVQALQKFKGDRNQDQWNEEQDQVMGEYRGSSLIERYIDPHDTRIPDYATDQGATSIDQFYRFRTIMSKRFSP